MLKIPKGSGKSPRKLVETLKKSGGRNNQGKITVRHRGGGAKRRYRCIDFLQDRYESAEALAIEYDPNRSAGIARIRFADGEQRYIIAPEGLAVGMVVLSSLQAVEPQVANRMPLANIPSGTRIYGLELEPGMGAVLVRSAGMSAELLAIEGPYAQVKMPSGEVRAFLKECRASVGVVSNAEQRLVRLGKAGRMRHRGVRPTVRGKAMNPVDHRHGGGEGRHPIGLKKGPVTKWGKPALGVKTRKKKKWTNRLILKRRR